MPAKNHQACGTTASTAGSVVNRAGSTGASDSPYAAFLRGAIAAAQLTAVHDVADGGVAVALAEMALAGGIGAIVDRKQPFDCAGSFFAEDQGVYLVTAEDHALADFLHAAHAAGVEVEPLGRTGGKRLIFERPDRDDVVTLDALREAHEGFFPTLMGTESVLA